MFEVLFNQPLTVWQDGRLVFESGWTAAALALAMAAAAVWIAVSLWRRALHPGRRIVVGLLQLVAVATLLFALWRPALEVETIEPGENVVAWVLDHSASMHEAEDGVTRIEAARDALAAADIDADKRFAVARYGLGERLEPVDAFATLDGPAGRTRVAEGLETLLDTVRDRPLAAVVLVSDGSHNGRPLDGAWWRELAAAGVPVHTVGVGQVAPPDDLELAEVQLPDVAAPDAGVDADLELVHARGGTVRLRVTSGERLLHAEDLVLPDDRTTSRHRVRFPSGDEGLKSIAFTVDAPYAETNRINNAQRRVMRVADAPSRILYVEGEPRWEFKFIRRAAAALADVEIVSLLRTSPNKFYRQGVRDSQELADGFPTRREQLFGYDAVIIGSLEAAELDLEQQAALRDFVNVRGGSLLMLAGRRGLADGGWGRTPVAAALPTVLSARRVNETYERGRRRVTPTPLGERADWLRLADAGDASRVRWAALPEVADHQSIGEPKPGAVVALAFGADERAEPALAWHRYGQGQSFVLGTSGTWRWQMQMPSSDDTHERFWQQMLRHLVAGSLPRLAIDTGAPVHRDTDSIEVRATARQADYRPLDAPSLAVDVRRADGSSETVSLAADLERVGEYVGTVSLAGHGPFSVSTQTPFEGEAPAPDEVERLEVWSMSEVGTAERFGSGQNRALLERLADATGGSYRPLDELPSLAETLSTDNAALLREQRLPLWHMPALFLLIMLAKALEWSLRLRWSRL